MYKVLIVDDEPLFREAVKSLVKWKDYGFCIAGEAFNGSEALEFLAENQVDLILTDIRMPVMDGLELLQRIQGSACNIPSVVLSSYDEFPLVKEAFKLGTGDYILKPEISPDQLVDICTRLMNERENEKKRNEEENLRMYQNKELEQQLYQNRSVIKQKILKELIWGDNHQLIHERKQEMARELGLKLVPGGSMLMVVNIENFEVVEKSEKWKGKTELLVFSVLNILEEILEDNWSGDVFHHDYNEFVILFYFDRSLGYNSILQKVNEIYKRIKDALYNFLMLQISAGLCEKHGNSDQLSLLYDQAAMACKYSFVAGKERLVLFTDICLIHDNDLENIIQNAPYKLKELLVEKNAQEIKRFLSDICLRNRRIPFHSIHDVKMLYDRFLYSIVDYVRKQDLGNEFQTDFDEYGKKLKDKGSLMELEYWLKEVMDKICVSLEENNQLVIKAKQFIRQHFSENISLESVADHLGISKGYLSRLFKEKAGTNFIDYLTEIRIERAMELMSGSNLKIYEVADKVGYSNVEHFSKLFKRVTGKSPKYYMGN